jgi:hypothetical protein
MGNIQLFPVETKLQHTADIQQQLLFDFLAVALTHGVVCILLILNARALANRLISSYNQSLRAVYN